MERKNMVLLTVIAVATLLVAVVGATFAFFTATVTDSRDGDADKGQADITAGRIAETTTVAQIDETDSKFSTSDVYPGHVEAAALQVTVSTANTESAKGKYQIVYDVTQNTLTPDVEVTVYQSTDKVEGFTTNTATFNCQKQTGTGSAEGEVTYFETCNDFKNIFVTTGGATEVAAATAVNPSAGKQVLYTSDEFTVTSGAPNVKYYYVVFQFKNTGVSQNSLMNGTLQGKLKVENIAVS